MSVDISKNEMNKFNNSRNTQNQQTTRSIENLKNNRDQRREERGPYQKVLPTIEEDLVDDYTDHSRLGLVKKGQHANKENKEPLLSVRDSYDIGAQNSKNYRALGPPRELLKLPGIHSNDSRSVEHIKSVYMKHQMNYITYEDEVTQSSSKNGSRNNDRNILLQPPNFKHYTRTPQHLSSKAVAMGLHLPEIQSQASLDPPEQFNQGYSSYQPSILSSNGRNRNNQSYGMSNALGAGGSGSGYPGGF